MNQNKLNINKFKSIIKRLRMKKKAKQRKINKKDKNMIKVGGGCCW